MLEAPTVSTHGALPGRGDAAVQRLASGVLADVARGRDHHDARVGDALGGERQRVGPIGLADGRAHREVDDADVVLLVMREHPVERRDRVADRAAALGVENLERDQCGIGRYPCMTTERIMAVSRDDAGDVRPMALVVVRGGGAVDEIDERGDALVAVRIHGRRASSRDRCATR